MNDSFCRRVSATAGLMLAAAFSSPNLLAAEPLSGAEASAAVSASPSALSSDRPTTVLNEFADHAHSARLTSSWLSIGSGSLLVGSGLITAFTGERESYGHFVWAAGTFSIATGIWQLFLPSTLENLDRDFGEHSPGYTPGRLESVWKKEAEAARVQRYVASGIDLTFAAGGFTAGTLLAAGVGDMSHGDRTAWTVTSFATGGLMTLAGVITLARKSDVEQGYALAFPSDSAPKIVDVGMVGLPGGGSLQVSGTF